MNDIKTRQYGLLVAMIGIAATSGYIWGWPYATLAFFLMMYVNHTTNKLIK